MHAVVCVEFILTLYVPIKFKYFDSLIVNNVHVFYYRDQFQFPELFAKHLNILTLSICFWLILCLIFSG